MDFSVPRIKNRNKWGKAIITLIFFLLATGLGNMVLSKMFTVKTVTILDTRPELSLAIEQYIWEILRQQAVLFGRINIFLVPRSPLEFEIPGRFPAIKTARVLRELPGKIIVTVQEKVPAAMLFSQGKYYAVDPAGEIFEEVPPEKIKENNFPIIRDERRYEKIELGKKIINPEILSMLHDIAKQLPERFDAKITEITVPSAGTQEIRVKTNEKWTIFLDATRPLENQFVVLEKILTEQIEQNKRLFLEYIDLRSPGKAFYKYR